MRKILFLELICLTHLIGHAQDKWDLRRCVDFALANNISVKQADVQSRISALQYRSARLNQYPTAGFSTGLGTQFGRSIDRTTNQFTTTQLLYENLGLQGGVQLFGFGQLRNAREAASFNLQAA